MAAVDHLYRHLGMDRANVRRERLPQTAPQALSREEQRLLLRAAERADPRDRALVVVLLFAGLRMSEAVALDLDDVRASSRKGTTIVRSGRRDAYREVPLNALVRATLTGCQRVRRTRRSAGSPETPGLGYQRTCFAIRVSRTWSARVRIW